MNERTVFTTALEKENTAQRKEYLDEVCAGDPALRDRVDALLRSHEREGPFLDEPAAQQLAAQGVTQEEMPAATEDGPSLDFLTPSEKPGSLGRLGHYEIQEIIGQGGMGIVLKALDEKLHRVVAIKVMAVQLATSATARRRFAREAQAAAAVSHDNIVTIHAVEEAGPLPYLVMQYVAGLSLQQRLDRDGPLDLVEILRIGMQTASGLAAAHAQGLVHRDIKPANILLENGVERVKITDFGLARAAAEASLTQTGIVAGTPQYMSPEQAEGKAIDQRTDLFSLGSVLYATCVGRAPFSASGSMAVLKRVCEEAPSPIRERRPEAPDWLVELIDRLHAKDPAERFQSAAEIAELLSRHLAQVQHPSVLPLPPPVPRGKRAWQERRSRGRGRRWAIAAAVLALFLSGLSFTEAVGVTNFRATVIRIFTPNGTLVVQTDDPGVKVTIEGDGGLIITGAGLEEMRLRPGSYKVLADKNGKRVPLERELVSIARGGREVVKVKLEGAPTPVAANVEKGAFVLLGGQGVAARKFDTLGEAVVGASEDDTIEVRGNGPFAIEHFAFEHRLTVRAGPGFWPVFTAHPQQELPSENLLVSYSPLRLEGLEFRCSAKAYRILYAVGPIWIANCRFLIPTQGRICIEGEDACVVRNCEVLSGGAALAIRCNSDATSDISNCILVGHINLEEYDISRGTTIRFAGNTFVSTFTNTFFHGLHPMNLPQDHVRNHPGKRVHVAATQNIIASRNGAFCLGQNERFQPRFDANAAEAWIPRRVKWSEERNIYRPVKSYITSAVIRAENSTDNIPLTRGRDFSDWNRFWGLKDTGSSEGVIRFEGGDLLAKVVDDGAKLTPEDFRLRADSAGYRAGKDGKDLGADVDLVGPGKAYERWKTMPEYQQWLRDTGQVKK
jgi:serine/threonine protein kinase